MVDELPLLNLPISNNYKCTPTELDNLVYLVMKYSVGWNMRQADLAVVLTMSGGPDDIVGDAGISRLVSVVCDYLWDHICGEPEDLTVEQLYDFAQKFLFQWFEETTQEERSLI